MGTPGLLDERARHDEQPDGDTERADSAGCTERSLASHLHQRQPLSGGRDEPLGPRLEPSQLDEEGRTDRERGALAGAGGGGEAAPDRLALGSRARGTPTERVRQPSGDPGGEGTVGQRGAGGVGLRAVAEGGAGRKRQVPRLRPLFASLTLIVVVA